MTIDQVQALWKATEHLEHAAQYVSAVEAARRRAGDYGTFHDGNVMAARAAIARAITAVETARIRLDRSRKP